MGLSVRQTARHAFVFQYLYLPPLEIQNAYQEENRDS